MKLIHNATIEIFVRPGETAAALETLAPVPLGEVRAVQWSWHPTKERTKVYDLRKKGVLLVESETKGDAGTILVLQYRLSKKKDADALLARLKGLPRDEITDILEDTDAYLDEEGDLILKLDRGAAEAGELRLGRGLVLRINLAAFPKNPATCRTKAHEALAGATFL